MTTLTSDYKLIRRTVGAGFLLRGSLRREIEHYLFRRGFEYAPIREVKSFLSSDYLVEFWGNGRDEAEFDCFLAELNEQAQTVTLTVPMRRYKALQSRFDCYVRVKTNRGIVRRKAELLISIAGARDLYYALSTVEGEDAASVAETLRQGLIRSGHGLRAPRQRLRQRLGCL